MSIHQAHTEFFQDVLHFLHVLVPSEKAPTVRFESHLTIMDHEATIMFHINDTSTHTHRFPVEMAAHEVAVRVQAQIRTFFEDQLASLKQAATPNPDAPLTAEEVKLMGSVNVFLMDVEMDGGTFPPKIQKITDLRRRLKPAEQRQLITYFYQNARGSF
jgi:hypothetical protein